MVYCGRGPGLASGCRQLVDWPLHLSIFIPAAGPAFQVGFPWGPCLHRAIKAHDKAKAPDGVGWPRQGQSLWHGFFFSPLIFHR